MGFLSQIDTAGGVLNRAVTESGWIAGLLVLIVLAALTLFGVLVRGDRSELREINRFVRSEMPDVIDGNTVLIARFVAVLHDRPCLHDSDVEKRLNAVDPMKIPDDELADLGAAARKAAERIKRRAARREKDGEDSNGE